MAHVMMGAVIHPLKWLRQVRRELAAVAARRAFERGFAWAMVEHHIHGTSLDAIEAQIEKGRHFDYTAFEDGADLALAKMRGITT